MKSAAESQLLLRGGTEAGHSGVISPAGVRNGSSPAWAALLGAGGEPGDWRLWQGVAGKGLAAELKCR